jgi:NitT/TauT family transport system substrate-binding protein
VARKGINSVKDLAGKKVSAKIGTVAHLILIEALLKHDQTATQVELIDVSNSEGSRLLSEGKIDAAVMWQPDLSDTQKAIDGHIIHTTADLESLVVDILLMAPNITEDKIPQVQKFVDTWFEVQTHIKTKPNEVFSAVGNLLHQSAQSYQSDYQGLKPGDIELNRKYITEGELKRSIEKIEASMDKDTYQLNPNINVEPRFVKAI